jgi:AcrR family transcriptional regulator
MRAGVSHAAPYRHFLDKEALLRAIARQGFEWLTASGRAAIRPHEAPRERLDAYGAAYVRFAFEHPVHHRVMFSAELGPDREDPENCEGRAFDLLLQLTGALVGEDQDPTVAALAAWSLTHGLSMLILDGRIAKEQVADADAAAQLARSVIDQWRGPLG